MPLATLITMGSAGAQCLEVRVLDPSAAAIAGASVLIGAQEKTTDETGNAEFCDLGTPPHAVVIIAPDFQVLEDLVQQSEGRVAFTLQVLLETELIVVGTRAEARSSTESMVPVDVITGADFTNQGITDVADLMRTLTPSFNVNTQPISDAATIARPANLRNLAPDHTLILVNGKRRHRTAVITWLGNGIADGSQGPDLAVIPAIALKQVEVLRDGSSAQYGSDAIAGVMNFRLKDARSGGSVEFRTGAYRDGNAGSSQHYADAGRHGRQFAFAGNVGLPLPNNGFANISVEYGGAEPTNRAVQRDDAKALIAAGNTYVRDTAQVWGSPKVENDLKFFGNFGVGVGSVELYSHTNYANKTVDGGFYYRNPVTRGGVFGIGGGNGELLIGDVLQARGVGSANCPTVPTSGGVVTNQAALDQVFADPNCFSFQELREKFRGGFTPQFGGEAFDASLVGGIRGKTDFGLNWDASVGYGESEVDYFIYNTVNASLGPESPTEFDPGLYGQKEYSANFDVSYAVNDMVNIASGFEWRDEIFRIGAGEPASWEIGPYAAQGFSSGSNGFNGFRPDVAAGEWSRSNIAGYGDIQLSGVDDAWTIGAAVRLEDFEDFGTTLNGKISGRVAAHEHFALRGGVSTGFRAPTPGQQNAFNVTTLFDFDLGDLVNNGVIPSINPVAELRGGEPLQPESALNYSMGAVAETEEFSFTADYFRIKVTDRIALTENLKLTDDEVAGLLAAGVPEAANLAQFRFFVNDFSSVTQGVDFVVTYSPLALSGTSFSFIANHTDTQIVEFTTETIDIVRINTLERGLPETRWAISWSHIAGRWDALARVGYYGSYWDSEDAKVWGGTARAPQFPDYSGKALLDLEFGVHLGEGVRIAVGGQNVLNTYPDPNPVAAAGIGNAYGQFNPFGFNGAYYYFRVGYTFGNIF